MAYVLQFGEIAHEEYYYFESMKAWKSWHAGKFFISELFHAIRRSKCDAYVLSSLSIVQRQSQANFKLMVFRLCSKSDEIEQI